MREGEGEGALTPAASERARETLAGGSNHERAAAAAAAMSFPQTKQNSFDPPSSSPSPVGGPPNYECPKCTGKKEDNISFIGELSHT